MSPSAAATQSAPGTPPGRRTSGGLSLRGRIFLQFFAAILPLLGLLIFETWSENRMVREVNSGLLLNALVSSAAADYRDFVNGVTDAVDTGQLAEGPHAALHRASETLQRLGPMFPDAELQAASAAARRADAALSGDTSMKTLMSVKTDINAAATGIKSVSARIEQSLQDRVAAQQSSGRRQAWTAIVLSVATLALLILVLRRTVRQIVEPIEMAVNVARRVTEGDLTGEVEVSRRDEFGELQVALLHMHVALSEIVAEVRRGSVQIADSANDIAAGTRDLAQRTDRQMQDVERITESAEALRRDVTESSEQTGRASGVAREAVGLASSGGEVMGDVVQTMRTLHAGSKQVVDFIAVIENIAFQTNILALNAAVEAARAGEGGRAFAVVAAEVRELANRSAASAREARELITRTFAQVDSGADLVERAGSTMTQIVEAVRSLSEMVEAVHASAQRQLDAAHAVAESTTQIGKITRENGDFVRETQSGAAGLDERAAALSGSVGRFKVLRHVRLPVDWPARIRAGSRELDGRVIDLSVRGLRLEAPEPLPANDRVQISFEIADGNGTATVHLEAQLVHLHESAPGRAIHGMRLRRIGERGRATLRRWFELQLAAARAHSSSLRANFDGLVEFDRLATLEPEDVPTRAGAARIASHPTLRRAG